MTAEERRAATAQRAARVFAERGFYGTSTLEVARDAGISHAYLFRLFRTKADLFAACCVQIFERVLAQLEGAAAEAHAAGSTGEAVLVAMGSAYLELLADRELALGVLNAQVAASSQPEVRRVVVDGFGRLLALLQRETGLSGAPIREFIADGTLLNLLLSLRADESDEERIHALWAGWQRVGGWKAPSVVSRHGGAY